MSFIDEKFIVAVATVIFFALTFKPMKQGLLGIANLKAEATKLLAQAQTKLAQSEVEAANILDHAKKEADLILSKAKDKLEKDIEVRKKLAMQKIQSFEENAINELKKNISQITVVAAAQIIEESGNDDSFKQSVAGSIEKLSKTVH
jgi:F-type H+-transporting ATPase subunit b